MEIEHLILAMIEHDLKICFGGLIGGLKPLPNRAKSFLIRPFFDPPGLLKVFRPYLQHGPMGFPHIAIFLLRASYAPKTSIFMIGMLVQWVRIKFG